MISGNSSRRNGVSRVDVVVSLCVIGVVCLLLPACDFGIRAAAARTQSMNNLKQLGIGVNNLIGTANGKAPPSYGKFGEPELKEGSLFFHLLPYLPDAPANVGNVTDKSAPAMKVFEAPLDPTNPGGQGLTSYCSNASIFGASDDPKSLAMPVNIVRFFVEKGSTNIIIFGERYASLNNAWSSKTCYIFGADEGSAIQFDVTPATAKGGAKPGYCQAFTSSGCIVAMGDGSVRNVNNVGVNPTENFRLGCAQSSNNKLFTSDW